jgi:hypothetical protein
MVDWRSDDRELLARILTAEAGNQGPIGMTAAGNVIMNRANTPGYGDGVRGVIMKPGQFSPMNSVTGYARGEQGQNIDALRPTETAYMVADSLLQGTAGDITGGATHFFNPDISNPSWAQGKDFTRIGDHVFGKADAGRGTTQNTGATAMRQPTMTQGQPAPMPQEQQQPGGLRGLLSDPDFYDRLAIGLGGLTMNPNQALMQMSADRIAGRAQTRQDTAATNRTVEYLRSQGRDDLADAVASGSLGGRDAAAILFQPTAQSEQSQIVSAAQLREMFPGTQIEDGLYNLKADGTANKVGGGGTTVNVDTRAEGKFEEAFATGDAKTINTVYDAGLQAQRNIGRIEQLDQLLAAAPSGVEGRLKGIAGEFGIATEGLSDIQAAQALINSLVPEQRQPGSGPMSDADLELFKQSLPRIINQPDGNRRIISTMRAIAEYDRLGAEIVQRMRAGEIDRAQAFQLLQERPNPLANFRAPAGGPASPAGAPSAAPAIRTFNPQTGQLE